MFRKYEKTYRILVPDYPDIKGKHYLSKGDVRKLFTGKISITEKMDGANTAIIRTKKEPGFHLQKRGSLVSESEHHQFSFFKNWAYQRYASIMKIPVGWRVYGELMRCVHSVYYNKLPDWFLVFGIYTGEKYLNWDQAKGYCNEWGFATVPYIGSGHSDRNKIVSEIMPSVSKYGEEEAEGIVVYNHRKQMRGKIVKPSFLKRFEENDGTHWINKSMRFNQLRKS